MQSPQRFCAFAALSFAQNAARAARAVSRALALMAMKSTSLLLLIDAAINLALGILLVVFPSTFIEMLGLPETESAFYPSILGAVLFGIGIALIFEVQKGGGLGLLGAVAINLSGGLVLGAWLVLGDLVIPTKARVLLWALVTILLVISAIELASRVSKRRDS